MLAAIMKVRLLINNNMIIQDYENAAVENSVSEQPLYSFTNSIKCITSIASVRESCILVFIK
jgi:hypothetical protein